MMLIGMFCVLAATLFIGLAVQPFVGLAFFVLWVIASYWLWHWDQIECGTCGKQFTRFYDMSTLELSFMGRHCPQCKQTFFIDRPSVKRWLGDYRRGLNQEAAGIAKEWQRVRTRLKRSSRYPPTTPDQPNNPPNLKIVK